MAVEHSTLIKQRNRHHLLYPARVWRSIGPNALLLRGAFIVKINQQLHAQLHRELDNHLGDFITRDMLPRKSTIKHIKKEYRKNEWKIRTMTPIEKLEWLEQEIDPSIHRNRWLYRMLDMQRVFLVAHQEEM